MNFGLFYIQWVDLIQSAYGTILWWSLENKEPSEACEWPFKSFWGCQYCQQQVTDLIYITSVISLSNLLHYQVTNYNYGLERLLLHCARVNPALSKHAVCLTRSGARAKWLATRFILSCRMQRRLCSLEINGAALQGKQHVK